MLDIFYDPNFYKFLDPPGADLKAPGRRLSNLHGVPRQHSQL
jgi:hypothetical protein